MKWQIYLNPIKISKKTDCKERTDLFIKKILYNT